MRTLVAISLFAVCAIAHAADVIEATTATGEKVRLLPNGHWEYVDQAKQAEAKKVFQSYPENRPAEAQGGLFGVGRTVLPGDKDYNRGSLNPKGH